MTTAYLFIQCLTLNATKSCCVDSTLGLHTCPNMAGIMQRREGGAMALFKLTTAPTFPQL